MPTSGYSFAPPREMRASSRKIGTMARPNRVRASSSIVPSPSQPATRIAPIRYQARYRGSLQPMAPPRNSVPADNAYQSMPIAHTSWYGRRRSRHWSIRKMKNTNDRTDDDRGRTTFGSTGDYSSAAG